MTIQIGNSYYLCNGTKVVVLRRASDWTRLYVVKSKDEDEKEVIADFLFDNPPGYAHDYNLHKLYIGSRFYANGKIWQLTGFKEDGRIRAQEFLRGFDTTYLIGSRGAPIDRLIGPVYLFRPEQVTQRHGEAPCTFDAQA